ncbi:hypothetical protein U3516DRAFT_772004 [Neocallimastix sp. 'constans']
MDDQLEISETNKEKNQIIENIKYKFNLWYITNNSKVFKYESEYYINERDENFMIFKNSNIIIFQSSFPIPNRIVYLIQPKYVLFIARVYAPEINSFYTTSLSILNNKEQETYELLFEELKKNARIFNTAIKIFPNITIKYCVLHYKRSLEESELIDIKCDKNDIIDLWYKCLLELSKL